MINLSSYDTTPNEKSQLFKILLKLKKKRKTPEYMPPRR